MNNINKYLDEETITTLKSTVDFLAENGGTIGKLFYQKLLTSNPDLKNIFNLTHQKSGNQPEALAKSVYAFANNLDNLDSLAEEISLITQKHVSLNIQEEQYPIIGENLLAAIHEVVTEKVNSDAADTITAAWGKGYGVLAQLLIEEEKRLYDQAENQVGGWRGLREFQLVERVEESEGIISFYLKPTDQKPLPTFRSGQYISIYVKGSDWEYQQIRQYSLSDTYRDNCFRLTIKKEGLVSNYLHDQLAVGDTVKITPPAGDFYLQDNTDDPVILLSAGVGVTPMISSLNTILETRPKQKVTFVHAVKNSKQHPFKQHVKESKSRHNERLDVITFYEEPLASDVINDDYDFSGLMDLENMRERIVKDKANYYLCGPKPFMASVHKTLSSWGVDARQIHYEVFGSDKSLS